LKIASAVAVPIILLSMGYGVYKEYNTNTTLSLPFQPPGPPVFWASFTSQVLSSGGNFGALLVKAGDPNAVVFVNNREYGRTAKGGLLQIPALEAGEYDIRLEKPGFQSVTQRAQILKQRETQLVFKLQAQTQVALENLMLIQQAVAGTRVALDGKPVGTVGADGSLSAKVTPGQHTITLEKDGYLSKTLTQQFGVGNTLIDGALAVDSEGRDWAAVANGNDLAGVEAFLNKYPNGPFAAQARSRAEQLEWNRAKDSNDEVALDNFSKKYPRGQYVNAAKTVIARLQSEDLEWHTAQNSKDPGVVQAFLSKYPHGRYASDAETAVLLFKDQRAIVQLLKDYQDSYNQKDLKQIMDLWPNCPGTVQNVLRTQFKASESGTLTLLVVGDPSVTGAEATALVARTRETTSANTTGRVQFKFMKQDNRWVINVGAF
jgi:hypothetical protein